MTAQESMDVFGQLVEADDPALVTDQDRESFRADLKKFDAHLRRAENDAINLGRWIIDAKEKYGPKYPELVASERPDLGTSSAESLEALARWERSTPQLYEEWRNREGCTLSMRYELAKAANRALAAGDDVTAALESRYPEVYARRKGKLLDAGNGSSSASADLPADLESAAPGLYALVAGGKVHPLEAGRIIEAALDAHPNAVQAVRQYGIRDAAALEALSRVGHSLDAAPGRKNSDLAGLFLQLHNTRGCLVLPEGEQITLSELSGREIWAAYTESVKEHNQGAGSKSAKVFGTEIALEEAIDIATRLGENDALAKLRTFDDETVFKLTVAELTDDE